MQRADSATCCSTSMTSQRVPSSFLGARKQVGNAARRIGGSGSGSRRAALHVVAAQSVQPYWYSSTPIAPPKKGKHFLHLTDFTKEELLDMLEKARLCKAKFYTRDESFKPFAGQTMAMIFTKPSARTRVSFETVGQREKRAPHGWATCCCPVD